jgi:hypothetical protein
MVAKRATVYSANAVVFNIATIDIQSGRGPSDFIKIAQQQDDFGYDAGLDGEGVFWFNGNRYTVLELTLMQTASGNADLTALHQASVLAEGLMYPAYMEDTKGSSKLVSGDAMILKTPDETFAKEPGTTVWMIGIHDPFRIVGGH